MSTIMKKNHLISVCVFGTCLLATVILCIACYSAFFNQKENGCEMTYMFEYPEYIRIKLKEKISENYPRYGLYLYGEGFYARKQQKSLSLNGVPVLFIPGNAGSYKQVRSLASVALRKAETHRNHFNYFTIDFDEDFSGLYGGVLMKQVNFVHSCLRHISRFYEKKASDSVILVGHSMGGIIARALFALENFDSKFVSIIITVGTPHAAPVVPLDSHLRAFYSNVNNFWESSPLVANVIVISLAGGSRDLLIPARYCELPRNTNIVLQYSAVTTAVPDVWLTIDHLALCWCKQLILVINRVLFAVIEEGLYSNGESKIKQVRLFQQYFGAVNNKNEEILPGSSIGRSSAIYNKTRLWNGFEVISLSGTQLIPVDTSIDDAQFIILSHSVRDISVFRCQSVQNKICTGSKVSVETLPKTSKEKVGFVHLSHLENTSHIMISNLKGKPQLYMQFLLKHATNKIFENFNTSGKQRFLASTNLFMNIRLPMIRNCFDVYLLTVEKVNCESNREVFAGRVHLPWSQEDVYARASVQASEFKILLKPHISKPSQVSQYAQLHVWKTDKCSLEVTVDYEFGQSLGRIFILYAPLIPQWIYSWMIIFLAFQLELMSNKRPFLSVWSILTSCTRSMAIPLSILIFTELVMKPWIGKLDWFDFKSRSITFDDLTTYDWAFPSCFIIMTSFVIFLGLNFVIEIILSSIARFLVLFPKHIQSQPQTNTIFMLMFYIGSGLVLFSLTFFCSPAAIYFLTIIIFAHCCKATTKCRILTAETSGLDSYEVVNKLNLSKLILLFFIVVCFQTTPAFIVWLKVFPTSWFLPLDPFRTLTLLLAPTVVCRLEMKVCRPPSYAAYIILFIWCAGCLFHSLDRFPHNFGIILLITNVFVFRKDIKHKKS